MIYLGFRHNLIWIFFDRVNSHWPGSVLKDWHGIMLCSDQTCHNIFAQLDDIQSQGIMITSGNCVRRKYWTCVRKSISVDINVADDRGGEFRLFTRQHYDVISESLWSIYCGEITEKSLNFVFIPMWFSVILNRITCVSRCNEKCITPQSNSCE